MAWSYVCPKCKGTDVYFAKKQILTGIGGVWGNRAKEVQRPFCKECDIEANSIHLDSEGNQVSPWTPSLIARYVLWLVGTFGLLIMGFIWLWNNSSFS